jgi:hypothetical protein
MLANPMNLLPVVATDQPNTLPAKPPITREANAHRDGQAPGRPRPQWSGKVSRERPLPNTQASPNTASTKHSESHTYSQHYLGELEVLRTSERARNIHRLTEIRDKADNMPAVHAIKMLEQIDEASSAAGGAQSRSPGVVVIVQTVAAHAPQAPNPVQVIDNSEGEHEYARARGNWCGAHSSRSAGASSARS